MPFHRPSVPARLALSLALLAPAASQAEVPLAGESRPIPRVGSEGTDATERSTQERSMVGAADDPLVRAYLRLRPRFEYADERNLEPGSAFSLRSVVGLGTRTWRGWSLLAEVESVVASSEEQYFDLISEPNARTAIADPEGAEINQLYVDHRAWATEFGFRAGRQRLTLDDERFIGSASARQNEMTFDAFRADGQVWHSDLSLTYAYLMDVRRPFGDRGGRATQDFESDSHLLHLDFSGLPPLRIKLFAYWLELENAPQLSSDSYGVRIEGTRALRPGSRVDYVLSYVHQDEGRGNPVSYRASYQLGQATLTQERVGALGVGVERLGAGSGTAVFATPLATFKKFNGLADAFLDNGGERGLRDWFLHVAPEFPGGLDGGVTFHWFQADEGGDGYGWEVDTSVAYPLSRSTLLGFQVAYFHGRERERPTRTRALIELTYFF